MSTFFVVSTSQPFDGTPSQFENPVLHVIEQAPSAQVAVELFVEHALLQAEQFPGSESVLTSQPSFGSPLQSAQPALQLATAHAPFEQIGTAFAGAQTAPQAPQLATSRFLFASHPVSGSPSQSPRGATHVSILQTPPSHFAAAFAKTHTFPHAPQFAESPSLSTSQPVLAVLSQSSKPAEQLAILQVPPSQLSLAFRRSQTNPQPPQLPAFVSTFVSHPFVGSPSQSAKLGRQVPRAHFPPEQPGFAFGNAGQVELQEPQCFGSVRVLDSQPSRVSALQSAKFFSQWENWHWLPTQTSTLPESVHALPHEPQFAALRERSAHSVPQQSSPDGHMRDGEQPVSQRRFSRLQMVPSGQSESSRHPTHTCWVASQVSPIDPSLPAEPPGAADASGRLASRRLLPPSRIPPPSPAGAALTTNAGVERQTRRSHAVEVGRAPDLTALVRRAIETLLARGDARQALDTCPRDRIADRAKRRRRAVRARRARGHCRVGHATLGDGDGGGPTRPAAPAAPPFFPNPLRQRATRRGIARLLTASRSLKV